MKKGIVLETQRDYARVLTTDGEYCLIPKGRHQHWKVGEEISVPNMFVVQQGKRRRVPIQSLAMIASVLILLVGLLTYDRLGVDQQAIGYVHLDINPSIEMTVNQSGEVLALNALNSEAEVMIASLKNWSHHSLYSVSMQLFQEAQKTGYIQAEHNIIVTSSLIEEHPLFHELVRDTFSRIEADFKPFPSLIAGAARSSATQDEEGRFLIHTLEMSVDIVYLAREQGLSPGKYIMYLYAVEQGLVLNGSDANLMSFAHISQKSGGLQHLIAQNSIPMKDVNPTEGLEIQAEDKANNTNAEQDRHKHSEAIAVHIEKPVTEKPATEKPESSVKPIEEVPVKPDQGAGDKDVNKAEQPLENKNPVEEKVDTVHEKIPDKIIDKDKQTLIDQEKQVLIDKEKADKVAEDEKDTKEEKDKESDEQAELEEGKEEEGKEEEETKPDEEETGVKSFLQMIS